ncbi:hypothetical protein C8J56DRAFT_489945 [Mycena floridula]|nr:hypothetical protein C8J56DRAFT_489945 [Mycena floridula]
MDLFSEQLSNSFLNKEWLVKIGPGTLDPQKSVPYMMKFYMSISDLQCSILVTDMKMVWVEVLPSNAFARRWRQSNEIHLLPMEDVEAEDEWRTNNMELLQKIHTLGAFSGLSFDVVESKYSDFAFELESESGAFKWRWETCFLGSRLSSDIISKHLIAPLISLNYLAFSSTEAVGKISDDALEKAIDKVGRSGRRSADTHIRNAMSKPRFATSLSRMTAMFNLIPDLPSVKSVAESPELEAQMQVPKPRSPSPVVARLKSPSPEPKAVTPKSSSPVPVAASTSAPAEDSATEESEAADEILPSKKPAIAMVSPKRKSVDLAPVSKEKSQPKAPLSSDDDSSPVRPPPKKTRRVASSSSDEDSDSDRKVRAASKSGTKRGGGTRQPIKRGKRF